MAAVLGVVVIATTLLLSVPAKTTAVDELTAAFRPVFTEQGAAQARDYVDTLEAMQQQLTTEALPGVASMLGVTPEELGATLATDVPTVAAGLQQLPAILARIDALVTTVEANIHNFELADSMPTAGLPTTAVTWQLALPAGVLVAAGAAGAVARSPSPDRRADRDHPVRARARRLRSPLHPEPTGEPRCPPRSPADSPTSASGPFDATDPVVLGANPLVGLNRRQVAAALGRLLQRVAVEPGVVAATTLGAVSQLLEVLVGRSDVAPEPRDKRFAHPAWRDNPVYRRLLQAYLVEARARPRRRRRRRARPEEP